MTRPKLLDLFCCAGGAGMGYHRAGFDVVGVDLFPQKRYPFEFHQGDALEFLADHGHEFDAIHASPPCQDYSRRNGQHKIDHGTAELLPATRAMLQELGLPWVIENVTGSPLRADYLLCGCMFGLPGLRRERWFETSFGGEVIAHRPHVGRTITVAGHTGGTSTRDGSNGFGSKADWESAMGIDWMTVAQLAQAIPPAYTEFIGAQLMGHLRSSELLVAA